MVSLELQKMGKTGIPDAVRATNRILSICFCYCPGNVLDKSRHCIGLRQVYPVTLVFIVPTTLSTDGTTELAHQMSWQGKTFFPQSCPQQ